MTPRLAPALTALLALAATAARPTAAAAQSDYVWTCLWDSNWSTDLNWIDTNQNIGVPPSSLTNTRLVFTADLGSLQGAITNTTQDIAFQAQGLVFLASTAQGGGVGPATFTIANAGQTLTLGTGGIGVQAGQNAPVIGTTIALGANQTWQNFGLTALQVSGNVNTGTFTLTYAGSANATLTGAMTGSGGLVVNATGTLTLGGTAANSYSGPTTVSGGTLLVNKTHTGTGAFTVQSTATFGGTGTLAAPVSIQSGGTLAPGTSPGTLTVNNAVTFSSGSTYAVELVRGSNTSDRLNATSLDLGGATLNLTLPNGSLAGGERYVIAQSTAAVTGTFAGLTNTTLAGNPLAGLGQPVTLYYNATVSVEGTILSSPGTITIVVVPEPMCVLAFGSAASVCVGAIRRFRIDCPLCKKATARG